MAARGPRFTGIPAIAPEGLTEAQYLLLNSLKENVELLTGSRGEIGGTPSRAVAKGDITIDNIGEQKLAQVTAEGKGFTINGQQVASLTEFAKLIADVQVLANDLVRTRKAMIDLIKQLQG